MKLTPDTADLAKLEHDLNSLPKAFEIIHFKYTHALASGWQDSIREVDAIDTGRYLFSVGAQVMAGGVDAKEFILTPNNTDVIYSDIVEHGRNPGGKPPNENHPGYAGRYPAGKSLDKQDSVDLLDTVITHTLDAFLHA